MFKSKSRMYLWTYVFVSVLAFIVGTYINNKPLLIIGLIGVIVGFIAQFKKVK